MVVDTATPLETYPEQGDREATTLEAPADTVSTRLDKEDKEDKEDTTLEIMVARSSNLELTVDKELLTVWTGLLWIVSPDRTVDKDIILETMEDKDIILERMVDKEITMEKMVDKDKKMEYIK